MLLSWGVIYDETEKRIMFVSWLISLIIVGGGVYLLVQIDHTGITSSAFALLIIFILPSFRVGHPMNSKCYQILVKRTGRDN